MRIPLSIFNNTRLITRLQDDDSDIRQDMAIIVSKAIGLQVRFIYDDLTIHE
jgi:hypothetical protein